MPELTPAGLQTYECRACGARFFVPRAETVVCCPVCRMNRIEKRD